MTTKKKTTIGVLILSLAILVGIAAVLANGPKGAWGTGFHPGFHRFHPWAHGEDMADFIMWKMDKLAKDLDLNATQRQEYEKIKSEIKTSIADAMERRMEFHTILRDEMSKENPDLNALASLLKERVNHIPDMVSKHIDLFLNFYNALDENQKARVVEMFRQRMAY
jgi:Spy/CpxP family protein refolding chaperone